MLKRSLLRQGWSEKKYGDGSQTLHPGNQTASMSSRFELNSNTGQGFMRQRWTTMSHTHDPRVTYSAEPWNNPLKQTTGLSGLIVDHRWRKKLMMLYTNILNEIKMVPETNVYRQTVENIYREFLRIVTNVGDTDWMIVERKIGLGQVEQLVQYAMDERELVQSYAEWKLWLIPIETIRECVEESKASQYYNKAGPPEPYLSDAEISDMKKIDQQRMAEEQKYIAADLKRISGKSTRMMIDDSESREVKRLQYKAAVEEYIRETKVSRTFEIASDGSVSGQHRPDGNAQIPTIPEEEADDRTRFDVANKYDVDVDAKKRALEDWKETAYWNQAFASSGGIPAQAEGTLPTRLQSWESEKEGGLTAYPGVDMPHNAPASHGNNRGRRIAKWIKPGQALSATQEQPPQKKP